MYFIVFVQQIERNLVVPYAWVRGINLGTDQIIETFVNVGVNSNRRHLVYWTDQDDAFNSDGIPLSDFIPSLIPNQRGAIASIFPNEGWYYCYIRRFRCKFRTKCIMLT